MHRVRIPLGAKDTDWKGKDKASEVLGPFQFLALVVERWELADNISFSCAPKTTFLYVECISYMCIHAEKVFKNPHGSSYKTGGGRVEAESQLGTITEEI